MAKTWRDLPDGRIEFLVEGLMWRCGNSGSCLVECSPPRSSDEEDLAAHVVSVKDRLRADCSEEPCPLCKSGGRPAEALPTLGRSVN